MNILYYITVYLNGDSTGNSIAHLWLELQTRGFVTFVWFLSHRVFHVSSSFQPQLWS